MITLRLSTFNYLKSTAQGHQPANNSASLTSVGHLFYAKHCAEDRVSVHSRFSKSGIEEGVNP